MRWLRSLRVAYRRRTQWIPRIVKQIIAVVVGGTVLLVGIIMLVAPGPAFIVIPLGLAVLALEFAWARRWLKKLKHTAGSVRDKLRSSASRTN